MTYEVTENAPRPTGTGQSDELQRRVRDLEVGLLGATMLISTVLARSRTTAEIALKVLTDAREALRVLDRTFEYPTPGNDTLATIDALYASLEVVVRRRL